MSLHEMAKEWQVPFSKVHAAACQVRGGKLPKGRARWSKEEEDKIFDIVNRSGMGE